MRGAGEPTIDDRIGAIAERRDRESFVALFEHYGPRIKAYFLRHVAEPERAEEWVQKAMLTVWRKAHRFDARRGSGSTWIHTIARNERVDGLRRERMPQACGSDPIWAHADVPEIDVDVGRGVAALREAIERLPAEHAATIRRVHFGDEPAAAVARDTGAALGAVKSRVRLALKHLRHALRGLEDVG